MSEKGFWRRHTRLAALTRCGREQLAEMRAKEKSGRSRPEDLGPPNGFAMLPWLLMGMGSFSNILQGETGNPWLGGLGLLVFNSLYISVVFRAFDKRAREARVTRQLLLALAAVTFALAIGYGDSWLMFFPLLGLATGSVLRGRQLAPTGFALSISAAVVGGLREGWDAAGIAYGTFISVMVTAAILALSETVKELRSTREELARGAVEKERLRFSRDLHDLLGHTLSVIVVKAEATRRLAPPRPGRGARPGPRHRVRRPPGPDRDPRGGHRLPRGKPGRGARPGPRSPGRGGHRGGRPPVGAAARPTDGGAARLGGPGVRHECRTPFKGDPL